MKKHILSLAAVAAFVLAGLSSCVTLNSGASVTNGPIGPKMGEATSSVYFFLWSSDGEENNIKKAAENGGIKKINQVEYVDKSIFGGLVVKHTTRVWGE